MNKILIDIREENKWIKKYFENKDLITIEDLLGVIEDLDEEVECLKEDLEDLQRDIEENYELKNNDPYDYYGVSRNDF